jgi:hypothetical protein
MPKISSPSVEHPSSEMFDNFDITPLLLDNLSSIRLEFNNGRLWEINVTDNTDIIKKIKTIFREYETQISKIDFCLNLKN